MALPDSSTSESLRGRKPTFLHVRTFDRLLVVVDVRFSRTSLMLTDFSGRQVALEVFPTIFEPDKFVANLAEKIKQYRAAAIRWQSFIPSTWERI